MSGFSEGPQTRSGKVDLPWKGLPSPVKRPDRLGRGVWGGVEVCHGSWTIHVGRDNDLGMCKDTGLRVRGQRFGS